MTKLFAIVIALSTWPFAGVATSENHEPSATTPDCESILDPSLAHDDGLVSSSLPMNFTTLRTAYENGVFPWVDNGDGSFGWYFPKQRGILDFAKFHVSKNMRKLIRQNRFRVSFDQNFPEVIRNCAEQTRDEGRTWISPSFIENYTALHRAGLAHSVEVWNEKNELVGGLYGVFMKGVFAGESFFTKESNTSKIALVALVERLQSRGHTWMDIQMVSPVLETFGGEYIPGEDFLARLRATQAQGLSF